MLASTANQWDDIFQRDGRIFLEPAPVVAQFAEQLVTKHFRRVLDVGCGSGRHVVCLSDFGLEVYGMDYSPAGLRLASDWLAGSGQIRRLILADMRCAFPFQTAFFDALIATQVIHHAQLAIIQQTAREITRVVRPAGSYWSQCLFGKMTVNSRRSSRALLCLSPARRKACLTTSSCRKSFQTCSRISKSRDVSVRGDVVAIYQGLRL